MEPLYVVALLVVGIVVAAAVGSTYGGRRRARLRRLTGASDDADVERRIRDALEARGAAEDEADRRAGELETLADLVGLGLVRVDPDLGVTYANRSAHRLLQRRAGSMVGRSALEAFVDPRLEQLAASALRSGGAGGELPGRRPDGLTVLVRARRSPGGGAWIVLEDVSELRRLQRIRTEFIDNLSHELRTPLGTATLLVDALARDAERSDVPARMRERIETLGIETGHLVQMVNELLDLSRIESGGEMELVDMVDLGHLAEASVERLRLFAERQGVRLVVDRRHGLPPVRGDDDRLAQVLVNLVHNAVKFSTGGDVTIRVAEDGGEVVVAVEDHGVGIPKADLGRIFERFYKVDRARVRGGGTGLGLAIARHIVENHGGRIWVVSEEGRGSTFSFAIPVAGERSADPTEPATRSAAGS